MIQDEEDKLWKRASVIVIEEGIVHATLNTASRSGADQLVKAPLEKVFPMSNKKNEDDDDSDLSDKDDANGEFR